MAPKEIRFPAFLHKINLVPNGTNWPQYGAKRLKRSKLREHQTVWYEYQNFQDHVLNQIRINGFKQSHHITDTRICMLLEKF